MLKDLGATWVILGHSERRSIFQESDQVCTLTLMTWMKITSLLPENVRMHFKLASELSFVVVKLWNNAIKAMLRLLLLANWKR